MLRDLKHLHGQYPETVFLKLLDDVADSILGYRVWFDNGKSALQSLHSSVVCPSSLVFRLWFLSFRRNTHGRHNSLANFSGRFRYANARRLHRFDLLGGSSLPARDDSA